MQAFIGNTHIPTVIQSSIGRSDFQTNYLKMVASDTNTDFLCADHMCNEPYKGPFMFLFYTKDKKLNAHWVGVNKLIRKVM